MNFFIDRRQFLATSAMALGASATACTTPVTAAPERTMFQPTADSLNTHQVPNWFKQAKYGIFIHWGPYSIPAYAPDRDAVANAMAGPAEGFKLNPYAEWYLNTMKFEDSPTAVFHRETYGENYSYDRFGEAFNESLDNWDPDAWARDFKRSGARYVVIVAKHHDGFLLWPSATPNPFKQNWGTSRDVIGELAEAVRAQGLKFGIYYSGGVDWTFKHKRVEGFQDLFVGMPGDAEGYTSYANAHYAELVRRYKPDYLWNDIGYPSDADAFGVIADYYNQVPDGLTNDRWMSPLGLSAPGAFERPEGVTGIIPPEPPVWDVRTPEYGLFDRILPFYWETTRGLGKSFGYNRNETEADLLSTDEIITMLTQSAAFNGNVLLNVGPRGDAQLDPAQVQRLDGVGEWLGNNGAYIQDTNPVELSVSEAGGVRIGAVETEDKFIVHLLGTPDSDTVTIALPEAANASEVRLLGGAVGDAELTGEMLTVSPSAWPETPTQIIAMTKPRAS